MFEIAAVTCVVVPQLVVQIPMVPAWATLTTIAAAIMALVNWRIFICIFSRSHMKLWFTHGRKWNARVP